MKKIIALFLGFGVLLTSCSNDDDVAPAQPADVVVQDFMWKAMNTWYFWQDEVPDLADTRFSTEAEYTEFLKSEPDPAAFLEDKLLFNDDRFTFYAEDYEELVQSFAGISKSNGLEFGLMYYGDGNDVLGYVRYIVPNSDASTKDIARGDIFIGVNGQSMTDENYIDLLFGTSDSYTLNMADIVDSTVIPNDKEVALTKEEGLVENPVFLTKTFEVNGEKIGYLVYNSFTSNFDEELNNAFGTLKTAGVTDLVLDLRYNPGGSVNSSRLLASMIYGTNTDELYIRQRWNSKIQAEFDPSDLEDYFANKTGDGTDINTLNLSRVFVLATSSSASASELVMNGLAPYIDVLHVGETTTGKNEFSITLVDNASDSYVYNPSTVGKINAQNSWGLQPLVGRNENADGFSDYTEGLEPDFLLREDVANLGILGSIDEPLLARAIQEITGIASKARSAKVSMPVVLLSSSKMFTPIKDNMYLEKPVLFEK
ncbi:MAG: S41 family peptidase [Sediminicola sp.]